MKQRLLALALAVALCLCLMPASAAIHDRADLTLVMKLGCNQMMLEGTLMPVDAANPAVAPIAEHDRTLVPVSRIVAAFGGESGWEPSTNLTRYTLDDFTVTHTIGTNYVTWLPVGEETAPTVKAMETASKAMNDRTYVPVRYVLEGLDLWVGYEPENQLVVVSTLDLSGQDLKTNLVTTAFLAALGQSASPQQPVQQPAQKKSAVVPDVQAFSGNRLTEYPDQVHLDYTVKVYALDRNDKFQREYLELLAQYGFRLRDSYTSEYIDTSDYVYDYTGQGGGTFDADVSFVDSDNVALWVLSYPTELHVAYADGFTYADTGERTGQQVTSSDPGPGGGSSGSSGGSSAGVNIPDFARKDCAICHGSGNCQTCNGRGYLWSSASGKYDRNCYQCATSGRCRYCHGTGKQQ